MGRAGSKNSSQWVKRTDEDGQSSLSQQSVACGEDKTLSVPSPVNLLVGNISFEASYMQLRAFTRDGLHLQVGACI